MPHCSVPLCKNYSQKTKGTRISYHRLPNGPLKSVWLRNIRRENPRPRAHTFVCSTHFTEDCFQPGVEIIPGFKKAKTLLSSAIPTIFKFGSRDGRKARPSSLRQIQNRARKVGFDLYSILKPKCQIIFIYKSQEFWLQKLFTINLDINR